MPPKPARRFARFRVGGHELSFKPVNQSAAQTTTANTPNDNHDSARRNVYDARLNATLVRTRGLPITNLRTSHVRTAAQLVAHAHLAPAEPFPHVAPRSLEQWHARADAKLAALGMTADEDTHTVRAELRWRMLDSSGGSKVAAARLALARRVEVVLIQELTMTAGG